jgi:hypothetical protein
MVGGLSLRLSTSFTTPEPIKRKAAATGHPIAAQIYSWVAYRVGVGGGG